MSHANLHLSSVLQYRAQNLEHPEVAEHLKISIPGVSAEFVKLNELESAVDSGVLNMISKFSAPGSAPNNTTTTVTSNTQLPYVGLSNIRMYSLNLIIARTGLTVKFQSIPQPLSRLHDPALSPLLSTHDPSVSVLTKKHQL